MQTLTPATTLRWLTKLDDIEATLAHICDKRDPAVSVDVWHRALNAKISAMIVREELTKIAVAPVEIEAYSEGETTC